MGSSACGGHKQRGRLFCSLPNPFSQATQPASPWLDLSTEGQLPLRSYRTPQILKNTNQVHPRTLSYLALTVAKAGMGVTQVSAAQTHLAGSGCQTPLPPDTISLCEVLPAALHLTCRIRSSPSTLHSTLWWIHWKESSLSMNPEASLIQAGDQRLSGQNPHLASTSKPCTNVSMLISLFRMWEHLSPTALSYEAWAEILRQQSPMTLLLYIKLYFLWFINVR